MKKEVEKYKKELEEELKKKLKKFTLEVATEVSLLIVGESYFPTLIFVFNEILSAVTPRRSQIKTRFKKRSDEITPEDLEILKTRLLNWTYTYVACRANYVSSDKHWRTTVYAENETVAKTLYTTLGHILEEPVDFDLLSFTNSVKRRPHLTMRKESLGDFGLNPITYDAIFPLKLRRAVLLLK